MFFGKFFLKINFLNLFAIGEQVKYIWQTKFLEN